MNNSCCCRDKQCYRKDMQDRIFGNAKKRAGRALSLKERKKIIEILKKEIEAFENDMSEH